MMRRYLSLFFTMAFFMLAGPGSTAWAQQAHGPVQLPSVAHATSAPLLSYGIASHKKPFGPTRVVPLRRPEMAGTKAKGGGGTVSAPQSGGSWTDLDRQTTYDPSQITLGNVFQGIAFTALIPPDDNLSVGVKSDGTTQIVQVVNTNYAVYTTSGTQVASGDIALNLFYNLSNSVCSSEDGGDPVVLFDKLDGRWIIGQLAYNSTFTDNHYCLAISQTSDATGSYNLYDISFNGNLPDYPKLAVWPDGIYFSANIYVAQGTTEQFVGAQACSFPRSDVLNPPAQGITFSCSPGNDANVYNILPADLENLPGTPNLPSGPDYYLQFVDNLTPSSGNILSLYRFDATTGSLSHLYDLQEKNNFYEACGGGTCIPQAGTTQQLDSLGDRLMYRLSFRAYANYDQMVVNQSVQVDSGNQQTGIRWYEIRSDQSGTFYINTESTFSPDSTYYRWMGSIAQNQYGDLGLGYSLSGVTSVPGIAITGLKNGTDTLMEQEQRMYNGSDQSYQGTYSRWGDYSSMSVDPSDDCSFWYTTEYVEQPVLIFDYIWRTQIGTFNFGDCTGTTFSVTTSSLPQATVLEPYSATLTATGGSPTYTWSGTGLPAWLSISNSGTISGTPTATGTSSFSVTATDSTGQTTSKTLSLMVNPAPSITTASPLPSGTVGASYSVPLGASGGTQPYSWSGSGLPPGLSILSSGTISGTPTTAGPYNVTVTVTDANSATASTTLSMTVSSAPLSVTTTSLPNGTVGTAYSATLAASGGTGSYSWSISAGSGSLPSGLSLDSTTGTISGTPSTAGTSSFTVQVSDGGQTATQALTITINPASTGSFSVSASPGNLSLKSGQSGSYTVTVTPSGGFTGSVDLSESGCPVATNPPGTGVSCSFSFSTVTITGSGSISSLLNVFDNGAGRTSSTFTITGTSATNQNLTSSTTVSLKTH